MNYYSSDMAGMFAAFAGLFLIIALVAIAASVLMYVFRSLGLMTIAKNRGLPNPWLAWIPIVGLFTLGAIADDINQKEGSNSYFRFILLGGNILAMFLSGTSTVSMLYYMITDPYSLGSMAASSGLSSLGGLISLATYVITIVCLNRLFKCYRPGSSTGWTVLCVFIPILQSIFPFVIRNDQPNWINPPYQGGPGGYQPPQGGYPPYQGDQNGYQPPQDPNGPTQ